jgi:hypothetical protein
MKKIVAVNCTPRSAWNTATPVREGAEVTVLDLYKPEKFTSCAPWEVTK